MERFALRAAILYECQNYLGGGGGLGGSEKNWGYLTKKIGDCEQSSLTSYWSQAPVKNLF